MKAKPTYKDLEKELERLRITNTLIEKSSIVQFLWKNEENWPVEYVSGSVKETLGYSKDDFCSGKVVYSSIIHPNDLLRVEKEVEDNCKTNLNSFTHEPYRVICKTGKIKWIRDITIIKRNENHEITHFEGIIIDITEQKEAEENLIKSELRWKFALEGNADGLWDWNMLTNEVFFSKQWKVMLGFSEDEISNSLEEWEKRIHPDDKKRVNEDIDKHLKGEVEHYKNEHRMLCKDGTYKWILDKGKIVSFDSENKPSRMIGTHSDISDRKKAEQYLKENEKKLIESNKTKDKFFSIIAHDLKSPFSSMLGFSEILTNNFEKYNVEKQKKFISVINEGIQNTYKLLDNLLLWSRSQQGTMIYNPQNVNLYLLSYEVVELMKQSIKNKSIKLFNETPENLFVYADEDMLSTVLRNLISNAIKFTPKGGEITIEAYLTPEKDFVKMSIKDNGIGISKKMQSKIFDTGENTSTDGTENEKGTGLGLILCKEFVEKHGGQIGVESETNKGSKFIFTLPSKINKV